MRMKFAAVTTTKSNSDTGLLLSNLMLSALLPFAGDTDRRHQLAGSDYNIAPRVTVRLAPGQTIFELGRIYHVNPQVIMAHNCISEFQAQRLPVGKEVEIPDFTGTPSGGFALQGLEFNNFRGQMEIARRLTSKWYGSSTLREGLALGFQYLSMEQRDELVKQVVVGLNRLIQEKKRESSTKELESYRDALAKAGSFDISNPFRLSPFALIPVINAREELASGSRPRGDERVVLIFVARGDWNGALCSIDLAVTDAAAKNLTVQLFEVGTIEDTVEARQSLTEHYRRGPDVMMIFAHGHFDPERRRGEALLAPASDFYRPGNEVNQFYFDTDRDDRIGDLVRSVAPGGYLILVSCKAGVGSVMNPDNMVRQMAEAARKSRWPVTVIGPEGEANLEAIHFPQESGDPMEVRYTHDSPGLRMSTVTLTE